MAGDKKVVIAGGKWDGPDFIRLKLHEEYGRVWIYQADHEGVSKQNGRILCIDDDGTLGIHAQHTIVDGIVKIEWPANQKDLPE